MKLLAYLFIFCSPILLNAQSVTDSAKGEFLPLGSLNAGIGQGNPDGSGGSVLPPRVSVNTYHLKAKIFGGKGGDWDFNFFNTLPTFEVKKEDSIRAFANELLNNVGGILNVSLGKMGHFFYGGDADYKEIRGAQIDFRAGAKLLDPPNRAYSEFIVPIFQTSLDLKYLIPLSDKDNPNRILGSLSLRGYLTYQKIFNSKTYEEYFRTERGNLIPTGIFTYNYEVNLFITNSIFISFGQSFANYKDAIPHRTVLAISYAK